MIERMLANGLVQVSEHGEGPALMLLHSLLADRSSFDAVIGPLSADFRVLLPALPGFGRSAQVDSGLEPVADRMADALREASGDRTGAPAVLGNGFGGFVALCMAIRHPGLISRLVLADAGAAFSDAGRAAFRLMAEGARAKGLEAIADVAMRRLFASEFHASHPNLVAERRRIFLSTDPQTIINACETLASMDLRPHLTRVSVPVLAIVGEQDEATPLPMSREVVSLLPDARLNVLEGLAHVPQLQAPERFISAILPFLRS